MFLPLQEPGHCRSIAPSIPGPLRKLFPAGAKPTTSIPPQFLSEWSVTPTDCILCIFLTEGRLAIAVVNTSLLTLLKGILVQICMYAMPWTVVSRRRSERKKCLKDMSSMLRLWTIPGPEAAACLPCSQLPVLVSRFSGKVGSLGFNYMGDLQATRSNYLAFGLPCEGICSVCSCSTSSRSACGRRCPLNLVALCQENQRRLQSEPR